MDYPWHIAFVGLYLLALIALGCKKAGGVQSQEDFSLAGRGLGAFVLVGTLLATWIGTGSIFGNAQKTYQLGVGAFILPLGGVLGIILLASLAHRIRAFAGFSVQDILDARFGRGARYLGTLTLFLAYIIIVSYQYRAGASVLEYLFGKDELGVNRLGATSATLIVAAFVILYTVLAGMVSVAHTDLWNGILISIGVLVALPILYSKVGGFAGIDEVLAAPQFEDYRTTAKAWTGINILNWCLPVFLLILGDANMYQRFFSAKSPAVAKRAATLLVVGILVLETAIIGIAFLGRVLVEQGGLTAPQNPAHIVVAIAFDALPAPLGAMLMGVIIAIVVSTADSFLLAPATAVVRDLTLRRQDIDPRRQVRLARGIVVVFGLGALGLAFTSDAFFEVALFAYTVYGASVTPVLIAAFFWKRATRAGAVASMVCGISIALGWQALQRGGEVFAADSVWQNVDAVLPALFGAFAALILVSLATKAERVEWEPGARA